MTCKNAMGGLPFGGGKSVLQFPDVRFDRIKLVADAMAAELLAHRCEAAS